MAPDADEGADRLGNRYANPHRPRWRVRVREGENQLAPFEVE
jgi:hypothetical protein